MCNVILMNEMQTKEFEAIKRDTENKWPQQHAGISGDGSGN